MFYRYEAKHPVKTGNEWVGIFQAFNPFERRQWYCLTEPKWYKDNPRINSKAWFTEYGYLKWKAKMEKMIQSFHFENKDGWAFRVINAETIENTVFKGKTQVIQTI